MISMDLSETKLGIQNAYIIVFITAALALIGGYVYTVGYTDDFVKSMVQLVFGVLLIGLGAALRGIHLGKNGKGEPETAI